jgi:hypothetical protein
LEKNIWDDLITANNMKPDIYYGMELAIKTAAEVYTYYYNEEKNIMIDEDGQEIFNIFSIITPNALYLFKENKEDMFVYGIHGELVELVYPYDEEC